jgi:hypothetical protein
MLSTSPIVWRGKQRIELEKKEDLTNMLFSPGFRSAFFESTFRE